MENTMELTQEQAAMAYQTMRHIEQVRNRLNVICAEFMKRAEIHDQSKMQPAEVELFTEYTPKLKDVVYGSDEYKSFFKDLRPALENHYAENSHHPEHYENGVQGMDLFDMLEMVADWSASSMRGKDGDVMKSVELNRTRFNLDPQVVSMVKNTLRNLGWDKGQGIRLNP